jgi:AGCS family alanine or glycine:cation symporter
MVGAVVNVPIVWSFADIANALMAIPNLLSLILLSGVIVAETNLYFSDNKQNKMYDDSKENKDVLTDKATV